MNMNITVKHIEELVSVREKEFRVEEVDGKFIITIIRDYKNKHTTYQLHKLLHQHSKPIKKLTEQLSNFIPNSLFVIKEEEINIPLNIETDYYIPFNGIVNNSTYGVGVDLAIDDYSTYVNINQMP